LPSLTGALEALVNITVIKTTKFGWVGHVGACLHILIRNYNHSSYYKKRVCV